MLNRVFPSRIAGIVDRKSKRSQFLDQLSAPWNYTNKDRWGDRVIAAASNSVVLVVGSVASSSWVVNWKNDEWWWMDCISGSFGHVTLAGSARLYWFPSSFLFLSPFLSFLLHSLLLLFRFPSSQRMSRFLLIFFFCLQYRIHSPRQRVPPFFFP